MKNDEYFGTICLCAMRYALGRQTYMPGLVMDYIKAHIKEIDSNSVSVMIRDIDEADSIREYTMPNGNTLKVDGMGDTQIERPGWEWFREFLKSEMEERNASKT